MIGLISILAAGAVIIAVYVIKSEYKYHDNLSHLHHVMSTREKEWFNQVKAQIERLESSGKSDHETIERYKRFLREIESGRAFSPNRSHLPTEIIGNLS